MFENGLIYFSNALVPAGYALCLALWWYNRKGPLLSSAPWIIGSFLYSTLAPIWTSGFTARFPEVMNSAGSLDMAGLTFGCAVALIFARNVWVFLLILMVTFNAAFLLEKVAPGGRFQSRLAAAHRFQNILGILLLLTAIFPTALTASIVLLWP